MKAVDFFAGAGGWSEAARMAGAKVLVAANHWQRAVETHQLNHPETHHLCQDVGLLDATTLPEHDLFLASPACQGHSPARGKDKPHHDESRSTAWCVIDVVEVTRPRFVIVENVPEFRSKWALYKHWRGALESLGYGLSENVLDASEFGVPQERKRIFIVGVRNGAAPAIRSPKLEPVPASSFIDFAEGSWSPVRKRGRAPATLARIRRARRDGYGERFLAPYYGDGSGLTGRSLARPLGTVTTRDRYAVVDGDRMRMLTPREYKAAMSFRPDYIVTGTRTEQIHQLGNAVCPLQGAEVIRQVCGG